MNLKGLVMKKLSNILGILALVLALGMMWFPAGVVKALTDTGANEVLSKTDTTVITRLVIYKVPFEGRLPVITLGQSVQDIATVTGANRTATAGPTGNVTFQWSKNNGDPWTTYSTEALKAKNNYVSTATSDSFIPPAPGYYFFRAVYNGDNNYNGSQSVDDTGPLTVTKAQAVIISRISATIVTIGDTVKNTVNINTTARGTLPAASGTWILQASQDPFFESGVIMVDCGYVIGNLPFFVTTRLFVPSSTGVWYFMTTYRGDKNFEGCQTVSEKLIVKRAQPEQY
jgi:hypothetical protein